MEIAEKYSYIIAELVDEYLRENCINEPAHKAFRKGLVKGLALAEKWQHEQSLASGIEICKVWLNTEDGYLMNRNAQRRHCERILCDYTQDADEISDALNNIFKNKY